LRVAHYESKHRQVRRQQFLKVRRVHELENEIGRLEAMPTNPGRMAAVRTLRKRLATVRA